MKRNVLLLVIFVLTGSVVFGQSTKVKIETSKGTMTVMLYDDTPLHRDNFVKLVESDFYTDLLFHRVISGFMIQGGDPESKNAPAGKRLGTGDLGYTVPAEISMNRIHKKGALAAARTNDLVNPKRASSGSQFYIVQGRKYTDLQLDNYEKSKGVKYTNKQRDTYVDIGGTPSLDNEYTVFGEVVEGLDVIDKIATVETAPGDRPIEDIKIIKMTIIK